jgi:phenylpyruvate tautomerase
MPFVELITNVSLTRAQTEELALSLSACAAETLQKPEFVFGINVRANEVLTFAGNWDPCMLLVLTHSFRVTISARIEQTRSRLLRMTN